MTSTYTRRVSHDPTISRLGTAERQHCRKFAAPQMILIGLFPAFRAVWLTGWYRPYRSPHQYFSERLPMAAPWLVGLLAMLVAPLS